ncbi:MAG: hypothetical protein KF832_08215 [Caldilineaceae bacterium]|nr:hypothetical protein [Caldilineaceae bacterium]
MQPQTRALALVVQRQWQQLITQAAKSPQWAGTFLTQSRQLLVRVRQWHHLLAQLPRTAQRRLQRRLKLSLAGAALALAIGQPTLVYAATITVGTTAPTVAVDSVCSLIEAIINANDDAQTHLDCATGDGADTINLSGNTYTLTAPYLDAAGLPVITSEITIAGAGATIEREAGSDPFTILYVTDSGALTLEHTTITGGEYLYAGGIYNAGDLTLTNSTVSTNTAYAIGGGILNTGILTLTNSTVSGNTVQGLGGGIANKGYLTLTNSIVSGNTSLYGVGGGLFNYRSEPPTSRASHQAARRSRRGVVAAQQTQRFQQSGFFDDANGQITLIDSQVVENSADMDGGGIFNGAGTLTLTNTQILTNTAVNCCGGGIYNAAGPLTITDSTISGNVSANLGGGLYTYLGDVALTNSTVMTNTAYHGGGLASAYATVTLVDSDVIDNEALRDGGGIDSYGGSIILENSEIRDNRAAQDGGGINTFSSVVTISSSRITGNHASEYGGGMASDQTAVIAENSTIANNTAGYSGGAIYLDSGSLTIDNSTISTNTATLNAGALGIVASTLSLNNSTLSGNEALGDGGALFATGTIANVSIDSSTIALNRADRGGGFFHGDNTTNNLSRSLVTGNYATSGGHEIYDSVVGATVADAQNLFGESSQSNSTAFTNFTPGSSDISATSDGTFPTALATILNPTLADNGGETLTHALVSGSPAMDAAGDGTLDTDQRGVTRPQGTADDIGAVEAKSLNGSGSVVQTAITAIYNATPQSCPAVGGSFAIHTVTPTLKNNTGLPFTELFFRVKALEYTAPQAGQTPKLCNATTVVDDGGVGSMLAIANSSLPGGDDTFNPDDELTQAFLVGLPVRAQYRIFVDLFSSTASAASIDNGDELFLGTFLLEFSASGELISKSHIHFLPLIAQP